MRKKIVITIIIIMTFFLGCFSTYMFINYFPSKTQKIEKLVTEYKIEEQTTFDAIDKVYDAVVVVETFVRNQQSSTGTGFVYKKDDKNGFIITNNHVIAGADKVEVIMANGNRVSAKVLGSDQLGDIAVLSIPVNDVIKVAETGKTDSVKVGSTVFAIGAPMGSEYSGTTTRGCISAKDRLVTYSSDDSNANEILTRVIQTDAAINPGNSGGPLINLAGQVIGITSLKLVQEEIEGIGFAIPMEDAMKYVDQLEKGQAIKRPVLGVQLIDVGDTYALFYSDIRIDKAIESGAVVQEVLDGSAAALAGLKKGDVITKVGTEKVDDMAELRYELYKSNAGDKLKITYYRNGETKEVTVTLKGSE